MYNLSQIPSFNSLNLPNGENGNNDNDTILNVVDCTTATNQKYKIIRYNKNMLSFDIIPTYGMCRSIIANTDGSVLCFCPPKSIPADLFIQKYGVNENNKVVAEEFVEGTMINVFWDSAIGLSGSWEISTRNTVGATSSFYKSSNSKTFRTMFMDACKENNLSLDSLDKELCYSFVLQHPENRIVVPFKTAQLYLISMYKIDNTDNQNIRVSSVDRSEFLKIISNSTVKFPEVYELSTCSKLIEKYASMNTSYNILEVVLNNTETGERTKIRNPVYEEVRQLRGNQPKLQYQYLCLRKEAKVADFLKYYPEHKKQFTIFRDQLHLFTNTLFANYVSCYIKKEKPLLEFNEQYRTHMFNIHQTYLHDLKEQKKHVTNTIVIKYVNEIHPSLLMFCLNFQMRKHNVDCIKSEV